MNAIVGVALIAINIVPFKFEGQGNGRYGSACPNGTTANTVLPFKAAPKYMIVTVTLGGDNLEGYSQLNCTFTFKDGSKSVEFCINSNNNGGYQGIDQNTYKEFNIEPVPQGCLNPDNSEKQIASFEVTLIQHYSPPFQGADNVNINEIDLRYVYPDGSRANKTCWDPTFYYNDGQKGRLKEGPPKGDGQASGTFAPDPNCTQ